MNDLGQVLAFGAGALCLGVWLTIAVLAAISARFSKDRSERYLGWGLGLPFLLLSGYLFIVAARA